MTATALVQSEKQFQAAVVEYAKLSGWRVFHPFDSRRSEPGWPDLTLVRNGSLIFAELKTEKGRLSGAQQEWLGALVAVEQACLGQVEVHFWKPSDWHLIEGLLR
jgi:hypothetical protein